MLWEFVSTMSKKKILTVGFELASPDTKYASFRSEISLLDYDIVLFKPEIEEFLDKGKLFGLIPSGNYQGKPSIDYEMSFKLKECCDHWQREIRQASDIGKTVIIYLSSLVEVSLDTGKRSYSGTGQDAKITY